MWHKWWSCLLWQGWRSWKSSKDCNAASKVSALCAEGLHQGCIFVHSFKRMLQADDQCIWLNLSLQLMCKLLLSCYDCIQPERVLDLADGNALCENAMLLVAEHVRKRKQKGSSAKQTQNIIRVAKVYLAGMVHRHQTSLSSAVSCGYSADKTVYTWVFPSNQKCFHRSVAQAERLRWAIKHSYWQ